MKIKKGDAHAKEVGEREDVMKKKELPGWMIIWLMLVVFSLIGFLLSYTITPNPDIEVCLDGEEVEVYNDISDAEKNPIIQNVNEKYHVKVGKKLEVEVYSLSEIGENKLEVTKEGEEYLFSPALIGEKVTYKVVLTIKNNNEIVPVERYFTVKN